jgi:hypothetical protein
MHLARKISLIKNGITVAILYTINPKSLHKILLLCVLSVNSQQWDDENIAANREK